MALFSTTLSITFAQEETSVRPIQYYQVLVPSASIMDWPFEGREPYFIYDRKEFEKITASSQSPTHDMDQALRQNAIRSTELFGELKGSNHIEGDGVFRVRTSIFPRNRSQSDNSDFISHDNSSDFASFAVPVDPIGFWLTAPTFADGEPITFGSDGTTSFLKFDKSSFSKLNLFSETRLNKKDSDVNNEDDLGDVEVHFQWSLRARRDHQGNPVFDLTTPNAPQTEWNLKIPMQWIPHISEGFLIEQPQNEVSPDSQSANVPETRSGNGTTFRNWKIFPGSRNQTVLTLVSSGSRHLLRSEIPIRQTITYNLNPEGLDVKSTIPIAADKTVNLGASESSTFSRGRRTSTPPLTSLQSGASRDTSHSLFNNASYHPLDGTIHLDAPLRLVSIYFGNQPLTTTLVPELDESGARQYKITIPEGEGRLTVNAFCPIQEDQLWNLPRIQFRSQNFFWMETRCDLFVKEPLLISAFEPNQATQTTATDYPGSAANWNGTSYSFLYYAPDSYIATELTLASPYITAKSGSVVLWEEDRIKCTMSFDFFDFGQSSKLVELQVQPHWMIDEESIESFPKERLLFWEGDSSEIPPTSIRYPNIAPRSVPGRADDPATANTPTEKPKSFFIYLKKPTKIRITGSRPVPESGDLSSGELRLNELTPVRIYRSEKAGNAGKSGPGISKETFTGKHLIALSASFPNRLRPVDDTEQRLKSVKITDPIVNECFFQDISALENSAIYLYDSDSATVQVKLEQRKLRFDSEIHCDLLIQDQELLKTYTFQCTPTENRIDIFHVHFSQKPSSPWSWTLRGSNRDLQCRVLSEEERKRWNIAAPLGGVVWEISLPTPRNGPFEIVATQTQSIDKPIAVPLAMIPESTSKIIELVIDSPFITGIDIINSKLKSIPIPAPSKNEYQSIRAAFRYDPHYDEDSLINPVLLLRPTGIPFGSPFTKISSTASFETFADTASFSAKTPFPIESPFTVKNPLRLKKPSIDSLTSVSGLSQSAWAWALQLDSQYESDGIVREHATFFIENRGQKETQITLPSHVPLENVLAVWIGDQRVTWNPMKETQDSQNSPGILNSSLENNSATDHDNANNAILLTLPKKQRFPLVSLEYWFHSKALVNQKKLRPAYPKIDMPVLDGTWIAWTPPEFQTFLRKKREATSVSNFDKASNFRQFSGLGFSLRHDPMEKVPLLHSFDPFSRDDWNFFLPSSVKVKECQPIAERLISLLGNEEQLRSFFPPPASTERKSTTRNRRYLRNNEYFKSVETSKNVDSFSNETEFPRNIERQSRTNLFTTGIYSEHGPKLGTQVAAPDAFGGSGGSGNPSGSGSDTPAWGEFFAHPKTAAYLFGETSSFITPRIYCDWVALRRIGIFPTTPIVFSNEQTPEIAGNVVLENAGISILFYDERTFLITSALNAVKYQQTLRPLVGERTQAILEGPMANLFRETLASPSPSFWMKLSDWDSQFREQQHPWGTVNPSSHIASGAIGWNAVELRRSESVSGIYVAHRPTFIAISRLAFLFIVVLSCWKPFSNVVFPSVCAMIFGALACFLSPYYAVIPTWAFFGSLCSVMFALIRSNVSTSPKNQSRISPLTSSITHADGSTDAEYEVQELRPFGKTQAVRAKNSESFFDKLKNDLSNTEDAEPD